MTLEGMNEMTKLDMLQIRGYKSIDKLDISLGQINVLIGGNGTGKSNFISLFSLLHEMATQKFQRAVLKRGGAQVLLHYGPKVTKISGVKLTFSTGSYLCTWEPADDGSLIISHESLFQSKDEPDNDSPTLFTIEPT